MPEERVSKIIFYRRPEEKTGRRRPRKRWLDDIEDLRRMEVKRWRGQAQNREDWTEVVLVARVDPTWAVMLKMTILMKLPVCLQNFLCYTK